MKLTPELRRALIAMGSIFNAPRPAPQLFGDDPSFFNYFADQDPIAFFGFSSLRAFADYVDELPTLYDRKGEPRSGWRVSEKMQTFAGTRDMSDALAIARNGWSDGLSLAHKYDIPRATNKRRTHAMVGGRVNVGRMLAGNPKHMVARRPAPRHRIITLFVECCMWKGITADNAIMRALLVAGMIDVLESEGYRCEIIAVSASIRQIDFLGGSQLAVRLKNAGDALSLADLSFALGHPSFLRRMELACEASAPGMDLSRSNRSLVSAAFDDEHTCKRNEFYIPQLTGHAQACLTDDPLSMLEWIEPDGLPVKLRSE